MRRESDGVGEVIGGSATTCGPSLINTSILTRHAYANGRVASFRVTVSSTVRILFEDGVALTVVNRIVQLIEIPQRVSI